MKLLDATVVIDNLRGRDEAVRLMDALFDEGEQLVASELLRFEVLAGARDDELARIEALLELFDWVDVSEPIARLGAEYSRTYRASHEGIDDVDYLTAATARLLEAELLTTNVRHFPMFEGLRSPY